MNGGVKNGDEQNTSVDFRLCDGGSFGCCRLVSPGGLIITHNTTNMRSQMADYLQAVTTDTTLETVFLHEQGHGISVTLKKRR